MKVKDVYPLKVAITPDDFPGFNPVYDVAVGDAVCVGSALMHDKNCPDVRLVSPVSGKVKIVERGNDRKIRQVIVSSNFKNDSVEFDLSDPFIKLLAKSGFLAMIRCQNGAIPSPHIEPSKIVVSECVKPETLKDFNQAYGEAIKRLNAIANGNETDGCVWILDEITVYKIGKLLLTGKVDSSAIIDLSGKEISTPMLVLTTYGSDIKAVLAGLMKDSHYNICICSDGKKVNEADGFLRYPYRCVTVEPEEIIKNINKTSHKPKSLLVRLLNFFSKLFAES